MEAQQIATAQSYACGVCGSDRHKLAHLCKVCKKILDRVDVRSKPNKAARLAALQKQWTGSYFRCHYTLLPLNTTDPKSPKYLTFDHLIPRDENSIVLAAAFVNDMKSDLDESEFWQVIGALAQRISNPDMPIPEIQLRHWRR